MFCPQCGQQQVSGIVRFCSRCGFPLDGVIQLLSAGGMLPVYQNPDEPVKISARRKGVKQGGMLLLAGAVLVPLFGVMTSFSNSTFLEILTAFAAIICFVGGPLRMLYAAVFEEEGALDKLEGFASEHGARFYGLPLNEGTVTLERVETEVPDRLGVGDIDLVPFHAGQALNWGFVD